jgi:uncharacterized protein YkwD
MRRATLTFGARCARGLLELEVLGVAWLRVVRRLRSDHTEPGMRIPAQRWNVLFMSSIRPSSWAAAAVITVASAASGCGASDILGADASCAFGSSATQCSPANEQRPTATPAAAGGAGASGAPAAPARDPGATTVPERMAPLPPAVMPDAGSMASGSAGMPAAPIAGRGTAGSAASGGGAGGAGAQSSGDEVPTGMHCAPARDWNTAWADFEAEVLVLTNEARARGADCGEEGMFNATTPLTMNPILRCSARLHSADMGEQEYFDHENLDMLDPFDRMMEAGYVGMAMGENIAMGQQTPDEVVAGWIDSDGHCANIMSPLFTELGVGYWEGEAENRFFNGNKLWTQNFGTPAGSRGGRR